MALASFRILAGLMFVKSNLFMLLGFMPSRVLKQFKTLNQ